jgi:molybdopterin synthase sulfur carrier subunit
MKITILLFAQLSELFQRDQIELDNVTSIQGLIEELQIRNIEFKNQKYSIAVNESITQENVAFKDGDTVALLPPFAGG